MKALSAFVRTRSASVRRIRTAWHWHSKILVPIAIGLVAWPGHAKSQELTADEVVSAAINAANGAESVTTVLEGCRQLIQDFDAYNLAPENKGLRRIDYGFTSVPKAHDGTPETLPVFWWKRIWTHAQYRGQVPLVFIHGGVGIDSWRGFRELKRVLQEYPGDYVAFDHRGEGCSKRMASNLAPSEYEHYRLRYVVKDMEYLRQNFLRYPRWRMLGQSRGASILLHYLANYAGMNPGVVESAHVHGVVVKPDPTAPYLILQRGFYRTGLRYLQEYPEDANRVLKIKSAIADDDCWLGMDGVKVCGPSIIDLLSFHLTDKRRWPVLHGFIAAMLTHEEPDRAKIRSELQKHVKSGYYRFVPYLLGTNLVDTSSMPSADQNQNGELTTDTSYSESFLCETRPLLEQIYPFFEAKGMEIPHSAVDPISYEKIIEGLRAGQTRLFFYHSVFDPIGNEVIAEANRERLQELGELFSFVRLENSSHEGWFSEERVTEELLRPSR
ncbi:MAG: alpha/beta fold hydrolase [Bdellovibrionales bacterium]